jgi:hypothetical protein
MAAGKGVETGRLILSAKRGAKRRQYQPYMFLRRADGAKGSNSC